MSKEKVKSASRTRRTFRVRKVVRKALEKNNRPRLTVHRTGQHIYAQIIDDVKGVTLAAASTIETDVKKSLKNSGNKDAATAVGKLVAERAKKAGVEKVAFDRGAFSYHGRVKALADAAREAGLSF
ncbi:MAG: 50S ribosomal protein L18 [Micavibrio sp.]|nr:50S ribosomal protein L18 [Micavibrio sp.]